MKFRAELFEQSIKDTVRNVNAVNAALGHKAYDSKTELARSKAQENVEEIEKKLEKVELVKYDPIAIMPGRAHVGGFALLIVGFVLQLLAELVKTS